MATVCISGSAEDMTCLEHLTSSSHVYFLSVCVCASVFVNAFMSVKIVTVLFYVRVPGETCFYCSSLLVILFIILSYVWERVWESVFKKCLLL